mmetsp:Transcript_53417/g.124371  ORF Transcript_53417/g.124371 Transcript_53417/m.124371 type:complete len:618 (+) Transcript_53417:86-1939(+)
MGQTCVSSCVHADGERSGGCESPLFQECITHDEVILSSGDDGMRRGRLRNRSSGSRALPEEFRHDLGLNSYLGTCSLGYVVRTLHAASGSPCALKRISKKLLVGSDWREDVEKLQSMEHRHVCRVQDAFEDATSLYLVMELCRGSNLNGIARVRGGQFAEAHAAVLVHQMLQAVAYMHSSGYVHGDICPENWLFEEPFSEGDDAFGNMSLKLIDYGFAKKHSREPVRKPARYSNVSMTGSFAGSERRSSTPSSPGRRKSVLSMGDRSTRSTVSQDEPRATPLFCQAPEQLEPGHIPQRSCDVWALGVIAFFLLSGNSPFEPSKGVTDPSNNQAFRKARYVFMPTEVWRNVSREAKSFIALCLQLKSEDRPPAKTLLGMPWMQMARGALETSLRPNKNIQVDVIAKDVDAEPALSNTHGTPVGPRLCFDDDPLPRSFLDQTNLSRMAEFQLAERDAVILVAHSVHKNHLQILQKFLDERDLTGWGLVPFSVLVQGMRFCGVTVKGMDDITGAVCVHDFLADVAQFQRNMQESALWFAFSTFDAKCTGEADPRALQKELCDERSYLHECFRINFPSLSAESLLPLLEQAPSHSISFEEFMSMLQRLSPDSAEFKDKPAF